MRLARSKLRRSPHSNANVVEFSNDSKWFKIFSMRAELANQRAGRLRRPTDGPQRPQEDTSHAGSEFESQACIRISARACSPSHFELWAAMRSPRSKLRRSAQSSTNVVDAPECFRRVQECPHNVGTSWPTKGSDRLHRPIDGLRQLQKDAPDTGFELERIQSHRTLQR